MKNTIKFASVAVLAVLLFGCGGGGGAATPQDAARAVAKAIKSESFDDLYSMQPLHMEDSEYGKARRDYRIAEGYEKWKWVKDEIEGNKEKGIEALDPEGKSEIKDEETWKNASPERLHALYSGCYKLYKIKKFEDRVKNAEFYITSVTQGKRIEDGFELENRYAEVRLANIYGDSIRVRMIEDNGLWYAAEVSLRFEEELPKVPEDK